MIESGRPELVPNRQSFHDWHGFLKAHLLHSALQLAKGHGVTVLDGLTWGKENEVDVRHPLTEGSSILSSFLNMPRVAIPGCGHCVRFADGKYGASERMVVAPGHESEGILHMPGGQSGQPGSRHDSDQQESWVKGQPAKFSNEEIVHGLTLRPWVRDSIKSTDDNDGDHRG